MTAAGFGGYFGGDAPSVSLRDDCSLGEGAESASLFEGGGPTKPGRREPTNRPARGRGTVERWREYSVAVTCERLARSAPSVTELPRSPVPAPYPRELASQSMQKDRQGAKKAAADALCVRGSLQRVEKVKLIQ